MPQLSELLGKKKFVKKEYRPWDLSGNGTVDGKDKPDPSPVQPVLEKNLTPEEKININEAATLEKALIPITAKTDNKTDNITVNKQVTIEEQPDNIKITKSKQLDNNKITFEEQPGNLTDNITGNMEGMCYLIDAIKKLSGIQKNIFYYLLTICSARNALDTGNILSSDLANNANCSIGSAKTSLIRLVEKRLVLRLQGKACRGGHMVLGITMEIQAAAIQAQQALFNPLKVIRTDNITGNTTNNMSSYSSSIYKNNITTSLPEEWKKIKFDTLHHIGFSETQLRQLYDSEMTTSEIVQDAINRFAYSLEYNNKVKAYTDPLNVLMGVLRKGQRWIEPNYVPPKELALRQILEEKRKQKEQYDAMIKELVDLEFPEWRKKLSPDDIKQIVPPDTLKANLAPAITAALRGHYVDNILLPKLTGDNINKI